MDVLIKDHNASFVKLVVDRSVAKDISQHYTYFVPNARFSPAYKMKKWDGTIKFYKINESLLPKGLVADLKEFLDEEGYEYDDMTASLDMGDFGDIKEIISTLKISSDTLGEITPNPHQSEAIAWAVTNGRGIIESPTSSGKSLIMYIILRILDLRSIIIVPSTGLVEQLYDNFREYSQNDPEWNVEDNVHRIYSGKERFTHHKITISTWQSFNAMKKDMEKHSQIFLKQEVILFDEVQCAKANEVTDLLQKFENAHIRLGFTGTVPEAELDVINLKGTFGQIVNFVTTKELMDDDIVSKVDIKMLFLDYPKDLKELICSNNITYQNEIDFTITSRKRTKFLAKMANSFIDNTLVIFSGIDHIEQFKQELIDMNTEKQIYVVTGAVKTKDRERIRKEVELVDNAIILATYGVFAAGVSINRLHHLIFASPRKSKINILQTIGRLLRKHDSKEVSYIYDIVDDFSYKTKKGSLKRNYLLDHGIQRSKFYIQQKFKFTVKKIPFDPR